MSDTVKLAVLQLKTELDYDTTMKKAADMVAEAARGGADFAVLPEMFNCPYSGKYFRPVAEKAAEGALDEMSRWARENRICLVGGSIPELEDGKLYNYTGGTTVQVTDPEDADTTVVVEESLSLRGSFNEWGETAMTKGDNGLWTITQEMAAGAEFKFFDEAGNWIGGEADGNFVVTKEQVENGTALTLLVGAGNNFQIPVAGTWTLTVNKAENTLVVSGEWPSDTPDEAMYLIGSFNEWNDSTKVAMTKGENGLWTVAQQMDADAEFKFVDEAGNWYGGVSEGNFVVTKEQVEEATALSMAIPGENFQIPVAGAWTLTVDRDSMRLVVAGEWNEPVVEPVKVYILGEVNDNGGWFPNVGTEMATEDGVIYTADIVTRGENVPEGEEIGYSYFSFTTQLAETDDEGGWMYIEPFRFGAVSEGDFLVTNELIGDELSLTWDDGQAFKIEAGEYGLTLNIETMTLVINKVMPTNGDLNHDGRIDIDDVNLLINAILADQQIAGGDLTGDGKVDVDDMNALINMILTQ